MRESDGKGYLLSLLSLMPARSRSNHLEDGIGGNRRKAVCDWTDGELLDGLLRFGDPNGVGLLGDADVGIFVKHLVDRGEILITVTVTARTSKVRLM